MTSHVTSADGTEIAYDQMGSGPPVVVAGGIFCDRRTTQALAEHLADACTVVNFDRRGRGESGDTPPYAVEREVEDIAALIAAVGGSAALYGHSSGAGLAFHAAARGLPITRLVLHEPPWGPDDDESTGAARRLAADVGAALAEGRPGDAIALFMTDSGLPPEMVEEMSRDPSMLAVAPTMPYDLQVMGDDAGGTIPEDLARYRHRPHARARRRRQPRLLPGHRRARGRCCCRMRSSPSWRARTTAPRPRSSPRW